MCVCVGGRGGGGGGGMGGEAEVSTYRERKGKRISNVLVYHHYCCLLCQRGLYSVELHLEGKALV